MPDDEAGAAPLPLKERLELVYERLRKLPAPMTADAALQQLSTTLEQVEDQYSGVPKDPDPGLKFDGRMYPPRADFIERLPNGGLRATTKGNVIEAGPDGSLLITARRTGTEVYQRPGATEQERRIAAAWARDTALPRTRGSQRTSSPRQQPPQRPGQQTRRDRPDQGRG